MDINFRTNYADVFYMKSSLPSLLIQRSGRRENNRKTSLLLFKYALFFLFFLWFPLYSISYASEKSLILQWEVSHSRNRDQISLIFREKTVELVTNTSLWEKSETPRLGRFVSPMNSDWREIKEKIEIYYAHLRKTTPVSSLLKGLPPASETRDPHAPVLHINGEEVQEGSAHFKEMEKIIYSLNGKKWRCIECAIYQKEKHLIERTVQKDSKAKKQLFSQRMLKCVSKGRNKTECLDPEFGIFEIGENP